MTLVFNYFAIIGIYEIVESLKKDKDKAEKEFKQSWGNLKEDDLITEENFFEFFEDISACFPNEEDFEQCLYSISYYYFQK